MLVPPLTLLPTTATENCASPDSGPDKVQAGVLLLHNEGLGSLIPTKVTV